MEFIDLKTQYSRYQKEIDEAVLHVLRSGKYILGPEVEAVEKSLAAYVGVKHCITAASGTDTLLLALMALGVGPGDEVITSPFTWISPAEMIALLGATPVFVDLDPQTYNIDPKKLEAAITPKTKAIMPVSLFGIMADLDAINKVAAKYELPVIEDAAQSFGATSHGRQSCSLTTIASTSFFPAKPLGCYGDGGALFTNDDELAKDMRIRRVHGGAVRNHHTLLGINGRFDTVQAAIIQVKLKYFPEEVVAREKVAKRYDELLAGIIEIPTRPTGYTSTYAMYTIRSPERDRIAGALQAKGIPTGVYYPIPVYTQPVFKDLRVDPKKFPVTEKSCQEVLSLPMHPFLDEKSQNMIVEAIREAVSVDV